MRRKRNPTLQLLFQAFCINQSAAHQSQGGCLRCGGSGKCAEIAVTQGVDDPVWEQYIAQAPRTAKEKYYLPRLGLAIKGETAALETPLDIFRQHIIAPLDAALESGASS